MGKKSRLVKKEEVTYICKECGATEKIPKDVVDYFDEMDDGDISYAPRFTCEKCNGIMEPLHYEGTTGIIYGID